jgi:diguanylate cyclase (GGDEF)-like protein/PAS domain S-box-containing protein
MPGGIEANLLALFESTRDLVWSVDLEYRLLAFNRALREHIERNFGARIGLGRGPEEFLPPDRAALWPPLYERALASGPYYTEYPLADGRTLELSLNPVMVDGKATGVSVFGRDITERKRGDESARFLAKILESSEDGVIAYDPAGAILSWNRGAERIYGYTAEEAVGKPLSLFVPQEHTLEVESYTRALIEGRAAPQGQGVGLRKDGRRIEISVTSWAMRDSAGKVNAISLIVCDESARQEGRRARALLASIVESSTDAIHAVNLDGTVVSWNRGAEQMFGYASDEAIGKSIAILAPEGRGNEVLELMAVIGRGGAVEPFETVLRAKDGQDVEVSLSISPIRSSSGKVVGASAIARDMAAHYRAERARLESEMKYQAIVDSAIEGIFRTTTDGRVLATNAAMAKMLGYDSPQDAMSAITNVACDLWLNPEERNRYLAELLERGTIRDFQCQLKRMDGSLCWASISARVVRDDDGQTLYLDGFAVDISEKKRAEEELRDSRNFLQEAQAIGGIGTYVLDIRKGVWTGSSLLYKLFGIDELYPRTVDGWAALVHPDDRAMMSHYLQEEVIGQKKAFDKEYRVIRPSDGAVRWVLGQGRLEFDSQGQAVTMQGVIRDITENKNAMLKLEESEARFRTFFEKNGSAMILVEPETGEIRAANEAAADFYGYTREQLISKKVEQLNTLPESEIAPERQRAVREGRARFNYRHRLATGEFRDVEVYVSPIEANGKTLLFSIVHDVSERTRAEERLRESEERFRATFEQAAMGIVHTSLDGRILRANMRFGEIVGYRPAEVQGMSFEKLTHPEDLAASTGIFKRMLDGEIESAAWEKRYVRKDGGHSWVRTTASTQRDCAGNPLHFIAVVEDINGAKTAEQRLETAVTALRESEERYRATFQMSIDAINVNRLSDGVFVDVNEEFLRFVGYRREEVIGHTSGELGFWVDPRDREKMVGTLLRDGICRGLEARFRRKNGEIVWGQVSESLIEAGGDTCILSVTRNISAQKEADARLAEAIDALRASEAHYRTVFQTSMDGLCISQLSDGKYIDANNSFLTISGYEREEVIGRTSYELNLWVDPGVRREMAQKLNRDRGFRDAETQFIKKNGERIWVQISSTLIEIEGVDCILSVVRDISSARAAEEGLAAARQALEASEARYRTAFQTSLDSININRLSDGCYIDCNQAFLDVIGYTRDEVIGRTSTELGIWANPRDRLNLIEILRQTSNCRDLEAQFRKKNGDVFWGQMSASLIEIEGVPCILSISRDISGAKIAEDEIRNLAFYDPLTHLPNRRLVSERLRQSLAASSRSNRKGALLFIDLDNFKTLNDTLGHKTGDLLLEEVAQRLTISVRDADTVARLGGDEFLVILEDLSENPEEAAAQAKMVSEKILTAISQVYVLAGRECLSTSSIGITLFGEKTDAADDILQQADIVMYQAKAAGRNTFRFFAPALQAAINTRASLEEDLRQAIGTDQFQLYYQPQVRAGAVIGAEALLRWSHPQRGFLPPMEFISVAEEAGLILPLGAWALETACRQISAWSKCKELAEITVAVNISARQLRQPDFVEQVLDELERAKADPKNLDLELTESMLVDNIEEVIAKMTVLKSHGVRFSLDDFGTGYSSLSYLKRLPLDQLKIDRAFVHDMLVDVTSGAIAQTVISLSKAMGLSVMAEGVETEEQRDYLAALGCDSFQGFLFSKAVPAEEFESVVFRSVH